MDAITSVPNPANEPVRSYAPGSRERASLEARLKEMGAESIELTQTIGGEARLGGGERIDVVQPHRHEAVLGTLGSSTGDDVAAAIASAQAAAPGWRALSFDDRAAVFLKAADLLAGPWRDSVNASTMLGQSKTVHQAEIDAACELIDFWRFNVAFARQVLADQPMSSAGMWNRMEHRPLEGFVMAITPFNFTSIAGNLPTAPALMGNVVIWKPATTQQLSAHYLMRVLEAAGLPPGVVNMLTGHGKPVSEVALGSPELAGIHFTGSTPVFQHLWRTVGTNIDRYRGYPRLVGETGGKDFVIAHASADPEPLVVGLLRGAFEYQGQKCSAASRAYIPTTLWDGGVRDGLVAGAEEMTYGDVTDFAQFGGAVIDRRSYDRLAGVLARLRDDPAVRILAGGTCSAAGGFFIRPTVLVCDDPGHEVFTTEYFGPILAVRVYDEAEYAVTMLNAADAAPYALTGAFFANDRVAIEEAQRVLRFSAGNFYV
ncbi:MAG: L-glutamate gamma-semialdehyde dehydrogenase, partial [Mycobacteriales bacterium]